jgi:hypothetical protein
MGLPDIVAAPRSIGRYFDVVTLIPASVFVAYVYVLGTSWPWTGTPHWREAVTSVTSLGLGGTSLLAVVAFLTGLLLHPLQFGMTQLLEGYWGATRPAQRLMELRVLHHRRRQYAMAKVRSRSKRALRAVPSGGILPEHAVPDQLSLMEAERLLQQYPSTEAEVMPTRLGNILRRYETEAGAQYGLPAIEVAPHLALVAPTEHTAYLDNQRTEMDLAIRLCWLSAAATLVTAVLFWRTGWWLALAALPYGAAYAFYRGTLIMAAEYGTAISTLLDLNRFALYERMHLTPIDDSQSEFDRNERLRTTLSWLRPGTPLTYVASGTGGSPDDDAPRHSDGTSPDLADSVEQLDERLEPDDDSVGTSPT